MRKFFSITGIVLLFLVALGLIFNEPLKEFAVDHMSNRYLSSLTADQVDKNQHKKANYDFKKVKPLSASQVAKASVNNDAATIGKMSVPSVGLYLPILKGLSNDALSTGGGTMKPNEKMGKGNYALAGHYMTNKGVLFSRLENVQLGDLAYITDMKHVYTYKVYYKKVVAPTAVYLIDDSPGKKLLTLITCADGGTNRWAIQGSLVKTQKATNKSLSVFAK
ncbi:class A sortase [Companilactobacillus sp.]|jgi:sortase A|uniref:class A sortase n=1 Tax=Companilactobacillus sp. TaxID=2767905 RepID=UPI0025BEDA5F|nr:class A sortase [Companilactobacillus sp.]MCH4008102.1 class A sortase [Companilactobacillus sp.]MCH4051719.1 class A sortase [Companilactobacillus sp.]MCH4076045.1 class A sortase [Companilactobacillus sp.]MCH4124620.1 class A sortase [Companilactobacillus sp.]MCH4132417.1 class A sortase [Companilactobacillus sp.]